MITCLVRAFRLLYVVQKAPNKIGETGWYSFNNRKGFMMAIKKKSNVKN